MIRPSLKLPMLLLVALLFVSSMTAMRALAAPFESEIKAFEEADKKNPAPQDAYLFVGSSSIVKWTTLADDFPDLKTIRRGFGGSQIEDSTRYADRIIIPYHPKMIIFYAGDNDLASGKSPQRVLEDYQAFVAKVHEGLPKTPIIYISIKASRARWGLADRIKDANARIKAFSESSPKTLDFVDVFTPMLGDDGKPRKELLVEDGLHMSRKGYELWTPLVRKHIDALEANAAPAKAP